MKWWNEFKNRCARDYIAENNLVSKWIERYIDGLPEYDKAKRERLRWKVQVDGSRMDTLEEPPREIPFTEEKYFRNEKDATEYAISNSNDGYKVEIWHLKKRY